MRATRRPVTLDIIATATHCDQLRCPYFDSACWLFPSEFNESEPLETDKRGKHLRSEHCLAAEKRARKLYARRVERSLHR